MRTRASGTLRQTNSGGLRMDTKNPDVWQLMFEQTPTIIRWILGVLTLGIFTLAGVLYKWHRQDLQKVHERIDVMEDRFEKRHETMEERMERHHLENTRLLLQISHNTFRTEQELREQGGGK